MLKLKMFEEIYFEEFLNECYKNVKSFSIIDRSNNFVKEASIIWL